MAAWEAARKSAATTAAKIEQLEREIEARFLADLGLKAPAQATLPKVFAVRWKDLLRWSVMFNQLASVAIDISGGKYPVTTLGQTAAVSYGIQKCPANRPGQHPRPYLRVANVQRDALDLREIKYIDVPDSELPGLLLESGDLLVCEGNSADLVGRPAIWRGEVPECVHQNHILKVRVDRSKVMPEFLLDYMSSAPARNHFRARAKFTTNLASINSNDLRDLQFPLPSLTAQRQIAERVARRRDEIAKLRADANGPRRRRQGRRGSDDLGHQAGGITGRRPAPRRGCPKTGISSWMMASGRRSNNCRVVKSIPHTPCADWRHAARAAYILATAIYSPVPIPRWAVI